MTIQEKIQQLVNQQRSLVDASRAAGNENLTPENQRAWDELQVQIDALKEVNTDDNSCSIGDAITAERQRVSEITALSETHGVDVRSYISEGSTVEEARKGVLEKLAKSYVPHGTGVTRDEGDKYRAAATDALLMRSGVTVERPADGANELRGYSLKDFAREAFERSGKSAKEVRQMDDDTIYDNLVREFYNPTSAFPAILDNTIKKSVVEAYKHANTTFEAWTSNGSVNDFKPTKDHEYILGSFSEFKEVPESGELPRDTIGDVLLPTRQIKTYGKSFTMSRQAFINDDIGFVTRLPAKFAASGKRTIEKQCYSILFNNGTIFDNKNLFCADHNNHITTGAEPGADTLQAAILKGQKQTDQFGEPILWTPKFLIVGVGYQFKLATLFRSAQVVGSSNNDYNPLYNYPLTIVETPILNAMAGSGACPWFLAADPADILGIQVDYLKGNKTPTVRRSEKPGTLGFTWDVFHDWGVSVRDFRGLIRNNGAKIA